MTGVNIPKKRGHAKSVVGESIDVMMKRKRPICSVVAARIVEGERVRTVGCVEGTGGVKGKGEHAGGSVLPADGITIKRSNANGSIVVAGIGNKRSGPNSSIVNAGRVGRE